METKKEYPTTQPTHNYTHYFIYTFILFLTIIDNNINR